MKTDENIIIRGISEDDSQPKVSELSQQETSSKPILKDIDFDEELRILLDDKVLETSEHFSVEPPKEMEDVFNTDYHVIHEHKKRFPSLKKEMKPDAEQKVIISGSLKGALLLLTSVIIFGLVTFGVYLNFT